MAVSPFKFGSIDASGEEHPFEYSSLWAKEKTTGPDRLIITTSSSYIDLLLELSEVMQGPFGVLYVLLTSRTENNRGRYQSPDPASEEELKSFLSRFRTFLECDARHHLWIGASDNSSLLVYDNHNVVYAYGPLPAFEKALTARGLQETDEIRFPAPHTHRYNQEFDSDEQAVIDYWAWKQYPLEDQDEP
jgi:hypothetical protein